ncbi:Patched domain-containing protein 3 [Holothuria leucospilota]|uniref:Patched domain-containing protein 3 n=1 Tax=Holothuria leucospilota TaxID=206669 RepID=A0A9Q1C196_HOLLE|nr:Patched domain-containing protein 3 [Holothuria leucospilota]
MKCNCVESFLRLLLRLYSKLLCQIPLQIIFLSLLVSLGLGSGIYFLTFESGAEYLFSPVTSRAKDDRVIVSQLFPVNDSNSLPNRLILSNHRRVSIIFTCKDGGNILRRQYMEDILRTDEDIRKSTFNSEHDGLPYNYGIVCSQWKGECFPNRAFEYFRNLSNENNSLLTIPYPDLILTTGRFNIEGYFGGELIKSGKVVSADAFLATYFLQNSPKEANMLSEEWETATVDFLDKAGSELTDAFAYHSGSLNEAQDNLTRSAYPYLSASITTLICFAVVSCIMVRDSRQSKPWLGLLGVVSAAMAVVSSVGLLSYCGVPFNQVTVSMAFIVLGIGLDDMFIMVATWRHTNQNLSVQERMAVTYEDAALSITITSLTDIMAFCIGAICPIPAVRIFCLYTGVAVFFDYIYQITFFGSCMVLFGHMEAFRCSGLCCVPLDDGESTSLQIEEGSRTNCDASSTITDRTQGKEHAVMVFFRDYYAKFISKPACMHIVIFLYIIYIFVAAYFCSNIQLGLEQKNIAEDGTNPYKYFELYQQYFKEKTGSVAVIIAEPYNYWDFGKVNDLDRVVDRIHDNFYVKSRRNTDFWLDHFKHYVLTQDIANEMNQTTFTTVLRDEFLKSPCCERFALDINFDGNNISSSRLILAIENVKSTTDEEELVLSLRNSVDNATDELKVAVIAYAPSFVFIEQFIIIIPTTIQTLSIAVVSMLVVSLLMMPNIVVGVMVTLSVASILVGVVGYMAVWDVALESISMVNLVLCIGFSVDFSAHVAYAYVMSTSGQEKMSAEGKLSLAFCVLGYPILQSGWSTIIGVSMLFFSASYIFRTFAKIMTLLMVLGMFHGLIFLPVAMVKISHIYQGYCSRSGIRNDNEQGEYDIRTLFQNTVSDNLGIELD